MKKNNIADYFVRVWGNDLFIDSDGLSYWGREESAGCQTNYDSDTDINKDIERLCDEIRVKFVLLDKLINPKSHKE